MSAVNKHQQQKIFKKNQKQIVKKLN